MKICLLTDAWTPVWGGGQKHIWETSRILALKYDVSGDIIVPNLADKSGTTYPPVETYFDGKLRVLRIGSPFIFPDLLGRSLFLISCLLFMLSHDYDIYHCHAYQAILLPVVKFFKPRSKVVYTVHGAGVNMLGAGIINRIYLPQLLWKWLLYEYPFDLLISVARKTIESEVEAKNFAVIGNGVNVKEFDQVQVVKNRKIFKILWVGRKDDPVKGLRYLQAAVKQVQSRYSQVKLVEVTDKFGEELIKEFKASDLFVLSSLSEGLPLTILEAMAAKLPVVTTDVGDCRSVLEKSGGGLVVAPGDSVTMATAIEEIIAASNWQEMGVRGYRFVKKNYTWKQVAFRLWEHYLALFPVKKEA